MRVIRWIADVIVDAAGRWFAATPSTTPVVREPYDDEHEQAKQRALAIMRKHERRKRGLP